MGILRRLSLVMKSYIDATGDRMERIAAEEEMKLARTRREATQELRGPIEERTPNTTPDRRTTAYMPSHLARLAPDYRRLGLEPGADLPAVEAAWRGLASRADPKRFPSGSDEERRAAEILGSLNEAYARLREALNPTEGRFGQLEL